ncbi:Hypothetical protein R9X50_00304600 [Acrodontium crateriforme]|uniref:Aldose 1-epimerase n=1 Tax=Acrodontium crateriforme TaxID=150365 RepID=A0AAQ3RBH4_9PEZI|nr:Hypothetical protein R9X50_00304600 [Acrodontium crateriforme]
MRTIAAIVALPLLALGKSGYDIGQAVVGNGSKVLPNGKYEIESEGIRANFIPYGASLSNLFITDVYGKERDIVLGFDNATYYSESKLHPHLNGVPGRYANRIKNGTFEIDGVMYHTNLNDNGGLDTLHGGSNGWDYRNWTVIAHTTDSITFSLVDDDGEMGFPGQVIAYVTYTLTPHQYHLRMTALATTKSTPIMLTQHTYLNLDGFQNPNTPLALNYSFHVPTGGLRTAIDNIEIPTGDILANKKYSVNDFWSAPKQIGANFTSPDLLGNCGFNCSGYDTCYILNRDDQAALDWRSKPIATLASPYSGISLDLYTDQAALQMYSCNNLNGTLALKETQGFFNDSSRPRVAEKHGCVVLEVEDWIDGINNPEWRRKQIYGPGDEPYSLEAFYDFRLDYELAVVASHKADKH